MESWSSASCFSPLPHHRKVHVRLQFPLVTTHMTSRVASMTSSSTSRAVADFCAQATSTTCFHGGVCVNGDSGFTCDCSSVDYEGDQCETGRSFRNNREWQTCGFHVLSPCAAIDSCPSPNPCQNDGVCFDLEYDYSCQCTGYGGEFCENGK